MRRGVALVLSAGCWTSPTVTTPPLVVTTPAKPAGICSIEDFDVTTTTAVRLHVAGLAFGTFESPIARLAVTFEPDHAPVAHLETETVELRAAIDLDGLRLRPRDGAAPFEGWLTILGASPREASGTELAIDVELPTGISPPHRRITLRCDALTFASSPEYDPDDLFGLNYVTFPLGSKAPISLAPGGPAVATIAPSSDDVSVRVLEYRDKDLRIELAGPRSIVTGWVSRELARSGGDEPGYSGFGYGYSGQNRQSLMCPKRIAIYVDGGRGRVLVGHYKPDVEILVDLRDVDRYPTWLGAAENPPYVLARDVDHCND